MSCTNFDLTIDGALADPMVAAIMRADHIDPQGFERLLRSTARQLDETRIVRQPFGGLADRIRGTMTMSAPRW